MQHAAIGPGISCFDFMCFFKKKIIFLLLNNEFFKLGI